MRYILALLLPWLAFFTIDQVFYGLICLVLQISFVGWLPAAVWALYAVYQYKHQGVNVT